ncbi:MAG: AAA family ATPase [Verrucomicrobiota bacterium]|nr:AAA family ATPase [Verrucomicrobiota bacterium]
MKITKIQLRGFRSHLNTEVVGLEKFCCFLGKNGAGKSSILDAIGYALTGVTRGVDDRGSGAEHLVTRKTLFADPEQAPKAFGVSLMTTKGAIVRGLGEGPKAKVQAQIGQKYGIDPVLARTLVQTASFTRLPPATQKQIVLSVAGSAVSDADIRQLLGPAASQFDATTGPLDSVEAIDRAEKELRALRPELKRQIAAVIVPDLPASAAETASVNIRDAEEALRDLRRDRDAIVKQKADYDARVNVLKQRLIQAQEVLNSDLGGPPKGDPAAIEKEIKKLEEAENGRDAEYNALRSEIDQLSGRLEQARQQFKTFSGLKGKCPTCVRILSKTDIDGVTKTLKDEGTKIVAELKPKQARLEELAYDQGRGKKILEFKGQIESIREHARAQERLKERHADARKAINDVEAALAQPAPKLANTAEIDAEIVKGEEFVGRQRALAGAVDERNRAIKQKGEIEARLSNLEDLIDRIGPKGLVRAKLMEGGGDQFVAEVNEYAQAVGLGVVAIGMENGFAIWIDGSPAALLSASEDYRLNLAFAAALAKRSGTGILILDGAEILDGDNRGAVNEVLERAGLEQAFLAATPETMPESVEAMAGWSLFAVEKDGKFSKVRTLIGATVVA